MAGAAAGGTLNGKREMPLGTSRFFMPVIQRGCRRDIFSARVVGGTFLSRFGPQARLYHAENFQPLTFYRGKNAAPTFIRWEFWGERWACPNCRGDIFSTI